MDPDADGTPYVFDLRFPGQRHDQASGLSCNYFRDYEVATGRYSQSDPIGLAGGSSTYGYVAGNPMMMVDRLGLVYGDGVLEVEDTIFGPTSWMREQMGVDPPMDQSKADFSAGTGDVLSLGATNVVRDMMGTNGNVNKCSTAYSAGEWAGMGIGLAAGLAVGLTAAGARGPAGANTAFSHFFSCSATNPSART